MARSVTWDELRELAEFETEHGCAVSLYLNLDPSVAPTPGDVSARVRSLLDEAGKAQAANQHELSHAQRQGVRADLERIRRYYEEEFERGGAHGLAVFAASLDNVWRVLPLLEPVEDGISVGSGLHVAPLVSLVGRGEGALVVAVSRERGQIFELRAGSLEELEDLFEEQPRRHDQGGWSQARHQRHIDNLALEHLRAVADHLDAILRRERGLRAIVVASEEARGEFSELLSHEASAAVVGQISAEAHATPAQLLQLAVPVLEEWRASAEHDLVEAWRGEVGRDGRASAGWAPTLEAASDGRVATLLIGNGVDRPVWRCPACGRLNAAAGKCALDGTTLEERPDGLDLVLRQTLAHGGDVCAVSRAHDLEPFDGLGASLRY